MTPSHIEIFTPLLLFFIGLLSGSISSVTGGSVFITAPLLTSIGMPLQSAIATSRVSSLGAIGAGLRQFHKAGKVDYRLASKILFWTLVGSYIGAHAMINLNEKALERIVAIVMLSMLSLGLVKDRLPTNISLNTPLKHSIGYLLFFASGVLAGFFGGQGIIASYLLMNFFGISPSESIGTRKVLGVVAGCMTLLIYASCGAVDWENGAYLVSGSLIGATFAAKWALKRGEDTLQWILQAAIIILAVKMLIF